VIMSIGAAEQAVVGDAAGKRLRLAVVEEA
jgi:hypothetical protein